MLAAMRRASSRVKARVLKHIRARTFAGALTGRPASGSFRPLLEDQIRTGTPTSTGLFRLGGATRGATSHLHQRRRAQAADSSPSSRAAFSRADIAKLASVLVSVMSV